jgi:hypothetical protein
MINDGGPAFPRTGWPNETGMTLRDYFAAKAMQALAQGNYFDATARQAYMIADAMLRERER